jgi:hypothetical protein
MGPLFFQTEALFFQMEALFFQMEPPFFMGLSQQFQVLEVLEVLPLFLGAKVTEGWRAYNISILR